jgi:O-antigen/teichoic acid export membrane protein
VLFRNTAAQTATQIATYAGSILVAPLMLDRLGLAAFGVWAVTGGLAAWAGALDFGITRSLSRFVALEHGRDNQRGIQETIGAGMIVLAPLIVIAALGALIAARPISASIGTVGVAEMRSLLLASAVILAAQTTGRVVTAIPFGLSRMVGINVAQTMGRLVNVAFSVAALLIRPNLETYAWANAAAEVVALAIAYIAVRIIWRHRVVALPSRQRGTAIVRYAVTGQMRWVAVLVNTQTDKIVLAVFIGPRAAGSYEIANRIVGAVNAVGVLTVSAMIPALTTRVAREGREFFGRFYTQYTERTTALAFPVYVVFAVVGLPLLHAWLGAVPPQTDLVLIMLLAAYLVNLTTGVGTSLAEADGDPGLAARPATWSALLNVALTVALAPLLGLPGVLAGTAVAIAFGALLFVVRFHRKYDLSLRLYFTSLWRPLAVSLVGGVPAAITVILIYNSSTTRVAALLVVTVVGGIYGLVTWLVAARLRLLPRALTLPAWRT